MKLLTLKLPDNLHKALKIKAAQQNKPLYVLMIEILNKHA